MAQAGYTPIQLYYSTTATNTPTAGNLANGELAINIPDGKLFYKDGATVKLLASNASSTGTVSTVSVTSANGFAGTVTNATTTPAITLTTTITGVLKGNGTAISAATAATDYVAPSAYASANGLTMSTARLLGRTTAATGAAEEITVGSGLTLSAGTLTSTGSGGTVTTVSVVSANGFAGSVTNASTTPAITISTSITGILSGNGTAISAATTTGSGSVVLATSPSLTTPTLGIASATSINKVAITAPATSATITIADGSTLSTAASVTHAGAFAQTFTATGTTSVTLPTSGTLLTTAGSGSSLTFGTGSLSLAGNVTHSGAFTQTFTATGNTSVTLPTSGTLATLAGTETLTNKRVTPRSLAAASTSGAIAPASDTYDQVNYLLTGSSSFSAPSGTPTNGQKLSIRLYAASTQTISAWDATYRVIGTTLPTSVVGTKTVYVGCVWNSTDSFWDVVAVATQA